jgi:hypothetical protein
VLQSKVLVLGVTMYYDGDDEMFAGAVPEVVRRRVKRKTLAGPSRSRYCGSSGQEASST